MEKPTNWHKVHEERNHLRQQEQEGGLPTNAEQAVLAEVKAEHASYKIADYGSLSLAKAALKQEQESFESGLTTDHSVIATELGPTQYEQLQTLLTKRAELKTLKTQQAKRLREMTGNPKNTVLNERIVAAITADVTKQEAILAELEAQSPDIARIADLITYRTELFSAGHIAEVPSVQQSLAKIEAAMIEGKPMFLHGPTGTGKTSLAIRSATLLTGRDPEIIYCNPQTRESNIFGKTGIGIDEATKQHITQFDPGPLVRAMQEGKVVIFDEFTALPKEVMVMLKGIMNAKPGDSRTVTGDGTVTIAPGFQMLFTANLKSDKNPERQDIPPEMTNEFSQNNLAVPYQTTDESYDIILARLQSPDGSINLSSYDLTVTLPKLCEAIAEIQTAYTGQVVSEVGSPESLKKYVLTQRNIENIISRYTTAVTRGDQTPFAVFLDRELAVTLNFREYSEKDRSLAAQILARHGLLSTIEPRDIGLPPQTFSFRLDTKDATITSSQNTTHHDIHAVATLDPWQLRQFVDPDVARLIQQKPLERSTPDRLTPEAMAVLLASLDIPVVTLDASFEDGVITIDIDPTLRDQLATWEGAKAAYIAADSGSKSWVDNDLASYPYVPLATDTLDIVVLNHGRTTPAERTTLVATLDTVGLRPLTLAEFIALGITRPEYNKRNEILNTYDPQLINNILLTPFLSWDEDMRMLGAGDASDNWVGRARFVFVRK